MSIKSKQYWRQKQKENLDTNYFNTVPHGIAVSLIFDIVHGRYKSYTSLDKYLSDPPGSQGNTNENMAETYQWLTTINQAPSADRLDDLINQYNEIQTECDTRSLTYNATRIHTQPQSDTDTTNDNSDKSTTTQTTATELTQF